MVEDADDVSEFQAGLIVEAEVSERLPVLRHHSSGSAAEFLGQGSKFSISIAQSLSLSPRTGLDGLDQIRLSALDTQKLCVRLRSVEAVLRDGGNAGH